MSGPNAPPMMRGPGNVGTARNPLQFTTPNPLPGDVAQYGMPQQSRAAQSAANGNVKPPPGYSPQPPQYPGPGSASPRPSAPNREAPSTPPAVPEPQQQAPASPAAPASRGLIPQDNALPRIAPVPMERPRMAGTFAEPSNSAQLLAGLEAKARAMGGGAPTRGVNIPQGDLTSQ